MGIHSFLTFDEIVQNSFQTPGSSAPFLNRYVLTAIIVTEMGEAASEADKKEQIWGNVLAYTTKYKEQLNTSAFDRKFSSGVRRQIITKEE